MQSWSIIIFGLNEEKTIGKVIADAFSALQKISNGDGEIIVVDDGSTDNTRKVVEDLQGEIMCLKTIFHSGNKGIGAALISGYTKATAENICAIPADGQFETSQLLQHPSIEDNTILSFYREKNEIYNSFRKVLSWSNRKILNYLFRVEVKDINWVKVYKRENLIATNFELKSSLVESEIFIKMIRSGIRLIETPTIYLPRQYGNSKGASLNIMIRAIAELPELYFAVQRFIKQTKSKS